MESKQINTHPGCPRMPGSRKPSNTKELNTAVARLHTILVTKAVSKPHFMRSRNVNEREANGRGGERGRMGRIWYLFLDTALDRLIRLGLID